MKESAVEWYTKKILEYKSPTNINGTDYILIPVNKVDFLQEQAKEMEKEQTIESYKAGVWDLGCKSADSEEYYNRTFKQEEQCKCGQPKIGGYTCQRTDCNQTFKQQEQ
jgi:hypothetical protein